jgi:hypothetical protein
MMTVYVLIREDQNEHGFVDTSVAGVFLQQHAAARHAEAERQRARSQGLVIEDDDSPDGEWQVSWTIEAQAVADLP